MPAGPYATVSLAATGQSAAIPVSKHTSGNIPVGLVLDFTTGSGVGTANAEFTFDDLPSILAGTAVWIPLTSLSQKTATTMDSTTMPMTAVRLNVTAYTSGTISLRVNQGVAQ